jgi:hypothetical protein
MLLVKPWALNRKNKQNRSQDGLGKAKPFDNILEDRVKIPY